MQSIKKKWHPVILIVSNAVAILLFASWLPESGRAVWDSLDARFFWLMNDSLSLGKTWQIIWAIANNRAFDLVAGGSMISLFILYWYRHDRKNISRYLALILLAFLLGTVMVQIGKGLPIERPSGTGFFPEAQRLSHLVPEIHCKDFSDDSFPGDHGLVLLICSGFALFYLSVAYGLTACCFTVIFTMPRLMSGAHWLTDEVVGALSLSIFALSWYFATPLHYTLLKWLEPRITALLSRLGLHTKKTEHPESDASDSPTSDSPT